MTWCSVNIKGAYKVNVTTHGVKGTDWTPWQGINIGPASSNDSGWVTSMGCPRAGTESDHWGWLYLSAKRADAAGFGIYFYVFFRLSDSGHIKELGGGRARMAKDSDQPDDLPDNRGVSNGGEKARQTFDLEGKTVVLDWYPDKDNGGSPKIDMDVSNLYP